MNKSLKTHSQKKLMKIHYIHVIVFFEITCFILVFALISPCIKCIEYYSNSLISFTSLFEFKTTLGGGATETSLWPMVYTLTI